MSPRRPVSEPPHLDGYTYERLLGSGGFADVFLYELAMPKMKVAVKVMVGETLTSVDQQQLTQEANTMAMFRAHPYIVGILNAAVSSDGRPYIVMEYYPRDNLWVRVRTTPLSVAEAIRTGVQVASAVETAHSAGIVHRDIKPANILISEFGEPGLTDFGIASTVGPSSGEESGLSIPWSPPEAFDSDRSLDVRSDVYSLGATVHTLLTGRSPFEIAGGANSALDLMERIERTAVPDTGRGDVPPSLDRVLRQSMAKNPDQRHNSALAFARDLQAVEQELHLKMTSIVIPQKGSEKLVEHGDPDAGETRGRMPVRIDPNVLPAVPLVRDDTKTSLRPVKIDAVPVVTPESDPSPAPAPSRAAGTELEGTHRRQQAREPVQAETNETPEQSGRARPGGGIIAGVVVAVAIVAVLVYVIVGGTSKSPASHTGTTTSVPVPIPQVIPTPTNISVTSAGSSATVSWTNPSPAKGDYFTVLPTVGGQQLTPKQTTTTSVTLQNLPSGQVCVEVELVRENGQQSSPSGPVCT